MATIKANRGTWWSQTATGTSSATATEVAVVGKTHYVTDFFCASDKADAIIQIKQGTTVIWQSTLDTPSTSNDHHHHSFQTPLKGAADALVSVTIDGTSSADANLSGFTLDT